MRVIVCGGRDYENDVRVRAVLNAGIDGEQITAIAEGGATGADEHAQEWAFLTDTPCETFEADWMRHGKAAGPIRNQQMLDEFKPDAVIAFPGGRGTADMVRRARKAGVRVIEVGA